MTNAQKIIETLRSHRAQFEAMGVRHLALFGSQARGDATEESDIDIGVEMDPQKAAKGLAYFGQLQQVEDSIVAVLEATIDLADEGMLRERVMRNYLKDRIVAF
jgi:predicted nucleotidyltransferase